jgi:hypothetical protein
MTLNVELLGAIALFNKAAAVALSAEAAFFLARGGTGLSGEQIAELAKTKFDYNLDVARALSAQRADTRVGFLLLLLSLVMAVADLVWEPKYETRWPVVAVIAALLVSSILLFVSVRYSARLARRTLNRVKTILDASDT